VLVFQPHRYSRTRDLFEDFVKVLSSVDVLLLTEVYPAGEAPIIAADSKSLARALRVLGKVEPIFVEAVDELPAAVQGIVHDKDIVLVMGAGSVGSVAPNLLNGNPEQPLIEKQEKQEKQAKTKDAKDAKEAKEAKEVKGIKEAKEAKEA
jgi:UDP-N-acetylmuramate--alanine ligase